MSMQEHRGFWCSFTFIHASITYIDYSNFLSEGNHGFMIIWPITSPVPQFLPHLRLF